MEFADLLYEARDGIARITINRPEVRNALRTDTFKELTDAFNAAHDDPTVGVVVLTGAGDKAFCAGGDVKSQSSRTANAGRRHVRIAGDLMRAMRDVGKPVIAAINGDAVGGGHELHLLADLSIAAEHARFGQVGPRVGSVPVLGGTQLLQRVVGEKRAREMVYMCRLYSAAQALQMNLVNAVVPKEDLANEVERWCQELLDKSPQALRVAKMSMNHAADLDIYGSYTHGAELLCLNYETPEYKEGPAAFLEKRKPDFRKFRA
jgi:naphthoate synthase/2-ketocyclohexanecarboxyl-CoA hydrolase